ncbi:hypothetical protein HA402_007779 [Bradysia odoriphaga]|nr:hypothetical protein HA402_007779 [Bradysia odoriphaga]
MEGGYINEGGQLKSKNGQKYVVNKRPAGVYIPKNCIFLTALLAVIAMIIIIVLTYLLLSQSCSANGNTSLQNDTISKAGLFGATTSNSNSVLSDQSDGNERGNAEIILNDGWNPRLYKVVKQIRCKKESSESDRYHIHSQNFQPSVHLKQTCR